MQEIHTLVTFSSRRGDTEKSALAAALGAVQAKSLIRLRWLRENVDDSSMDADPEWRENRDRMAREYIAPREIDFLWADVLVIGMPSRDGTSSPEWKTYVDALAPLHTGGKLTGKLATAFTPEPVSLCAALDGLDLILVPPAEGESTLLLGRRITEAARSRKQP